MNQACSCIKDFFNQGRAYQYKGGEIIMHPDDHPSGVYFIESGFVKIYSISQSGDERLHIIYKAGEIFPWIWVFKNQIKQVFYESMGPTILRRRSKQEFINLLKKCGRGQGECRCDINNDCPVVFDVAQRLIELLDIHVNRVENLEITNAYPRLIARLLDMAQRFGQRSGKSVVIDLPISHKDIASSINMTRETASREIEKLEKKDLIKYQGHKLIIQNLTSLEHELELHYERSLL